LFFLFIGRLSQSEEDEMRKEVSSVRKKMMEEKKRIELGKNKEECGNEMMKNIGMMKFIVCFCIRTE
jgi:hypothetical protein